MSYLKISMKDHFSAGLMKKLQEAGPRAAHAVAVQIETDTEPFVPFLTGSLSERTQVMDGQVIYPGPYAQFLYRGKVWVDPVTHAAGFLTDDGWKSRYGVKKIETDRNLVFTKAHHDKAQSHWFEASKAQNMEKWTRVAGRAIDHELDK